MPDLGMGRGVFLLMPRYKYNGITVDATRRRSSTRDDKKYMRTVTYKGDVRLVHYGDPNLQMQRDNPERRDNFLARHSCSEKKDPFKAGFWACYDWENTDEKSMNSVKLIKQDDNIAIVGGYGVVFGGQDLVGDTFTSETDFMLDLVPSKLTLYDHALGTVKHVIGRVREVKADDKGLWVQAELNKSKEYVKEVLELVGAGVLGWSSGSVPHLVQSTKGHIKQWPIVEFSLTATPAEPRTLGVDQLKILAAGNTKLAALLGVTDMETKQDEQDYGTPFTLKDVENAVKGAVDPLKQEFDAFKASLTQPVNRVGVGSPSGVATKGVNTNLKTGRGDSWVKAYAHFARTGDQSAIKASNNTDMNIGTSADGGYAVPTGHYDQIVARRDESLITQKFGVRLIPGMGTTVNVPIDAEDDGEFVSTAEAADSDRDAPSLNQVAMTLVKYTKRVEVSTELLEDEDSRLIAFLSDFVGRGMAKTHNNLLVSEVAANGATLQTTASATALAVGELEAAMFNSNLAYYLDDTASVGWVMRPPTYAAITSLTGNDRLYAPTSQGQGVSLSPSLLGYPVCWSNKVAAYGTTANKFALFGNFNYVGYREAPGFTVLRDPYSKATSGQVVFHYYFRTVYKVLQSEAVGYVAHA